LWSRQISRVLSHLPLHGGTAGSGRYSHLRRCQLTSCNEVTARQRKFPCDDGLAGPSTHGLHRQCLPSKPHAPTARSENALATALQCPYHGHWIASSTL